MSAVADAAIIPQAKAGKVPVLYYLAGLTCTEETFAVKAGAQRIAAELGLMLVAPDTSPRGANMPGETDSWDFGAGAGFYVDAIREPWSRHYRMYSYVTAELPGLICILYDNTKSFTFSLISFEKATVKDLIVIDTTGFQKTTRKKLYMMRKAFFENPIAFINAQGNATVTLTSGNNTSQRKHDTLELEY